MLLIAPFSTDDVLVARLTESLALRNGIDPANASLIGKAAALHDVGKNKVPSHILGKCGRLSHDEFRIVKTHTIWGGNILKSLQGDFGVMARNICIWHHEKFDKSGYWGKSLDDLPPYIPMVTICDVYVALTSLHRPYKEPWTHEEAADYIEGQAGTGFCPKLVKSFLALIASNQELVAISA